MSEIKVNIESLLIREIAGELMGKMTPEEREALLKNSIISKLSGFSSYEISSAIDKEAVKLAAQYMQEPDVQARIRKVAIAKVEELVSNLLDTFGKSMEDWAKTEWKRILKIKES